MPEALKENAQKPERSFKKMPEPVVSGFTWTDGSQEIELETIAQHIEITENDGEPIGSMFTISYLKKDAQEVRPVTFCFNGGPGSASYIINIGGIGPKCVMPCGDKHIGPAPYALEMNEYSLIATSDLVFIDALGTGWSRLADGVKGKRAYSLDKDAECFSRCIAAWLEKTGRWNSPLYLFGESYGTTRNAVLIGQLAQRGIDLNGVIMLSALFDWSATIPGNDANYIQLFPTMAAIAQYHGKGAYVNELTSDELFDRALEFAEDALAPALLKGDRLDADRESELAQLMSQFIGLTSSYIAAKHLRIELTDFRQELLRDKGKVVGRLDGRFSFEAGNFLQTSSEGISEEDPSDTCTSSAWAAGFRHHVKHDLNYSNSLPYNTSAWETIGMNWIHDHTSAGVEWKSHTPNVAYDLAMSMRHNPDMKVLILGGRYDMATPFLGPIEDLARMYLSDEIKSNLEFKLYDSGHMIYVNRDAFKQMAADVEEFYKA
ncbi:MAG: peptidase S10 [Coriobacteriales bacterium]|nr:peptidase S10 [Coriobacteriales bacterium]